ncbi:MAG TPA: hypothetical protein VIY52_05300 [Streptosporangiaceae bacterium]
MQAARPAPRRHMAVRPDQEDLARAVVRLFRDDVEVPAVRT